MTTKTSIHDKEFWNIADIAEYLGVSRQTLARRYLYDERFPCPLQINGSRKKWIAREVIEALKNMTIKNGWNL